MYLAAAEDRSGVVLLPDRRAAATVLWSVRPTKNLNGEVAVLLRGSNGLYLATSSIPVTVRPRDALAAVQRPLDDDSPGPAPPEFMWQAVQRKNGFLIRNGRRRFLRANGRHLPWRTAVTVALNNGSSMFLWDVEVVQVRPERVAGIRGIQENIESVDLFVKQQKDLLVAIRCERDERFGDKEDLKLKMESTIKKMRALTSEAKRIQKRETPEALPFALYRTIKDLEIAKKAYRAYEMMRIECQTSICSLNSQEAETKKVIEEVIRSREGL